MKSKIGTSCHYFRDMDDYQFYGPNEYVIFQRDTYKEKFK
jgi:hypothetical protein